MFCQKCGRENDDSAAALAVRVSELERELKELIIQNEQSTAPALLEEAFSLREKHYGNKVFIRGLIEISNYCKNENSQPRMDI